MFVKSGNVHTEPWPARRTGNFSEVFSAIQCVICRLHVPPRAVSPGVWSIGVYGAGKGVRFSIEITPYYPKELLEGFQNAKLVDLTPGM